MQTYEITKQCVNIRKNQLNEMKKTSFEIDKDFMNKEVEFKYLKIFEKSVERIYSFKPSSLIVHKGDCLLDYYLEEQEKRKLDGDVEKLKLLSERQLCTFTSDIFGAGLDTSNNTTAWFFFMMALYPDEQVSWIFHKNNWISIVYLLQNFQEAVRKEIRSVCGNSKPDLEHMADLIYTKAAICETQRIRPVVPLGLPHGTTEVITIIIESLFDLLIFIFWRFRIRLWLGILFLNIPWLCHFCGIFYMIRSCGKHLTIFVLRDLLDRMELLFSRQVFYLSK